MPNSDETLAILAENEKKVFDTDKLRVCEACVCYVDGCYFEPDCCLCGYFEECCCCHCTVCCKTGVEKLRCLCCDCRCIQPRSCCRAAGHECCCATAYSCPPSGSMPPALACFGISCIPKFGCLTPYGDIKEIANGKKEQPMDMARE